MKPVTVINCAAFNGGSMEKLAKFYYDGLTQVYNTRSQLINLTTFLKEIDINNIGTKTSEFNALVQENIENVDKLIFIVPEYNSSYPGVLKLFLDVVDHTKWKDKKVCIVGTSGGKGGNLRGVEHLTSIFNYLQMNVHYMKLPLSDIKDRFEENGDVKIETSKMIENQLDHFLKF